MITNRELSMDDYLAMLRRRTKVILWPALLAPLAGFLVSFAFAPKYTSTSLVVVEEQKVPEGYVKPVTTEDVMLRVTTIQQKIFSPKVLQQRVVEPLGLVKGGSSSDEVIKGIQDNVTISPVSVTSSKKSTSGKPSPVAGFNVNCVFNDRKEAQGICHVMTGMIIAENFDQNTASANSTTQFLTSQLDQARQDLDSKDRDLADFKEKHVGQLPGDEDRNLKLLSGVNSQLDATTQALNRAHQDRDYAQSVLAQQLAAWKASQAATNPQTLQQQLASLQSQLITLQARYTDDYPDVVKTKNDIAEVKRKLDEVNSASSADSQTVTKASGSEPAEIARQRLQIHQYDDAIAQGGKDEAQLQQQIRKIQREIDVSPSVEEEYKKLTRDYEAAQKFYDDLLTNQSESAMTTEMEKQQQGEQMRLVSDATLPDSPDFPNRWLFAGGGLGAGLALGCGIALWLELRDKSIRTEQDVHAVLELPMLVSLPWLRPDADHKNGRGSRTRGEKQTVEV